MSTQRGSSTVPTDRHNGYFQAGYTKRSQYISFTGTSAKSGNLSDNTSLVELFSTQDCWVSIIARADTQPTPPGAAATIVENIKRVRGGVMAFIGVPPGITDAVVAVVSDGTNGVLDITEYS